MYETKLHDTQPSNGSTSKYIKTRSVEWLKYNFKREFLKDVWYIRNINKVYMNNKKHAGRCTTFTALIIQNIKTVKPALKLCWGACSATPGAALKSTGSDYKARKTKQIYVHKL